MLTADINFACLKHFASTSSSTPDVGGATKTELDGPHELVVFELTSVEQVNTDISPRHCHLHQQQLLQEDNLEKFVAVFSATTAWNSCPRQAAAVDGSLTKIESNKMENKVVISLMTFCTKLCKRLPPFHFSSFLSLVLSDFRR